MVKTPPSPGKDKRHRQELPVPPERWPREWSARAVEVPLDHSLLRLEVATLQGVTLGDRIPTAATLAGEGIRRRGSQPVTIVGRELPIERLNAAVEQPLLIFQLALAGLGQRLGAGPFRP